MNEKVTRKFGNILNWKRKHSILNLWEARKVVFRGNWQLLWWFNFACWLDGATVGGGGHRHSVEQYTRCVCGSVFVGEMSIWTSTWVKRIALPRVGRINQRPEENKKLSKREFQLPDYLSWDIDLGSSDQNLHSGALLVSDLQTQTAPTPTFSWVSSLPTTDLGIFKPP